jgi:hypothetical protein
LGCRKDVQQGYLLFNESDPVRNIYPQILKQQSSVPQMNEVVTVWQKHEGTTRIK